MTRREALQVFAFCLMGVATVIIEAYTLAAGAMVVLAGVLAVLSYMLPPKRRNRARPCYQQGRAQRKLYSPIIGEKED